LKLAAYIALRYLRSRRRSRFLNRVTITAVGGIAVGVMVLDITLSVMNGFHEELRHTFVENMPMVTIMSSEAEGFGPLDETMAAIREIPEVTGTAPFIRQEIIATSRTDIMPAQHRGAVIWGLDPTLQETVTPLEDLLFPRRGSLAALNGETETPSVVLGIELAASLYVSLGDTITLTAPKGDLDLSGDMEAESRNYKVAGFLDTGMFDFDARFIYMALSDARGLCGYHPDGATAIGVRIRDMMSAPQVADDIEAHLGQYDYYSNNWIDLNSNLFEWVQIEKVVMFLLLGLIFVVAAFNIVGILTMMVGERRREIGILLSMGARRSQVQNIFLIDGMIVGGLGIVIGSLLGWLACLYLDKVGLSLPGDVYFVDRVPVLLQTADFLMVALAAMVITLLATLLPSYEAARLRPMDIIRYT
jgi:lipoprotein-releasing system permease protein